MHAGGPQAPPQPGRAPSPPPPSPQGGGWGWGAINHGWQLTYGSTQSVDYRSKRSTHCHRREGDTTLVSEWYQGGTWYRFILDI